MHETQKQNHNKKDTGRVPGGVHRLRFAPDSRHPNSVSLNLIRYLNCTQYLGLEHITEMHFMHRGARAGFPGGTGKKPATQEPFLFLRLGPATPLLSFMGGNLTTNDINRLEWHIISNIRYFHVQYCSDDLTGGT
jgi:hypothetical protein